AGGGVWGGCWPWRTTTSAARMTASVGTARKEVRMILKLRLQRIAAVDMRYDTVVAPEAHPVPADIRGPRHGDDKRGLAAGPQRRCIDCRASAGKKATIAIEQENDRREPLGRHGAARVAHD